ncbi:hypothetical protein [Mesorhizobium caraganae]|uniref:hypothetical protein n=1 Tax=Mesorhizobium caraganae TaxID=483206 RepID=UPI00333CA673
MRDWLGRLSEISRDPSTTKLVYQRGEQQSAAKFFEAVFDNRLNTDVGDFVLLDRAPEALGCIVRSAAIDNRAHLDRVCQEVRGDTSALLGWWATAEEQKALRFVFAGAAPALPLDGGWPGRGWSESIGGYDPDIMSVRPIVLQRDFGVTAPADFLEDLLTLGNQSLSGQLRGVSEPEQVPLAPGVFKFGEREWICPRICFDFSLADMPANFQRVSGGPQGDHVTATVTLTERRQPPAPQSAVCLFEGEVSGWSENHQWLALEPAEGADWKMVRLDGDGDPPPFWCAAHSISGFSQERGHAGLYVRHLAGDQLIAVVADRKAPRSLGGRQVRIEQMEAAKIDLGLGANSVAIMTGGSGVSPEQSPRIHLAGPDAIISGETLKIFDRTLSVTSGSIDAQATTTIKGTLDVSK